MPPLFPIGNDLMKPLKAFDSLIAGQIEFVLCDLDDTLTLAGKLPAASYGL